MDSLFFKGKIINGKDLEIIFHKDYIWIFNESPFPVISYKLINCQDLQNIKFDFIDSDEEGVFIEIKQENNLSVFETTDYFGVTIKIICDKILTEEREYNKEDYIDLLKEFIKQRDDAYETTNIINNRLNYLKQYLIKDLDIIDRKIEQANWLTDEKKYFLEGQKNIIEKTFVIIDKKEKEDF